MYINPNNNLENNIALTKMFEQIGRIKDVKKDSVVVRQGGTCNFFFYVLKGTFRAFRFMGEGETTIGFTFAGDIDTCPYSYINNCPSLDTIHALSDGKIIKVYKQDFLDYVGRQNTFQTLTEYMLSSYIEVLIQRLINLKNQTAEQNYLDLLQRQPSEVEGIPLSYIASYLGISRERLSRIRKKNGFNLT